MFVSKEGHLFAFGSNIEGQLGINDPNTRHSTAPLLVADLITCHIRTAQVACGGSHTSIVTVDGTLYSWGRNVEG
jgi:alpha-tubulin suppressor-like RCC1 family protein